MACHASIFYACVRRASRGKINFPLLDCTNPCRGNKLHQSVSETGSAGGGAAAAAARCCISSICC